MLKKLYTTVSGFTLIEALVSVALFALFSSGVFSIGISMHQANTHVLNKNLLYDETRILLEKVVRESRVNTIDYYEYFSRNYKGEKEYGQRPGQYEMHFYRVTDYEDSCFANCLHNIEHVDFSWANTDRSNDSNMGKFDTKANNDSSDDDYTSARTLSDPYEKELYLLSADGLEKTIFRLVQEVEVSDAASIDVGGTITVDGSDYPVIYKEGNVIRLLSTDLDLSIGDNLGSGVTTSKFQTRLAMAKMVLIDCENYCGKTLADNDFVPDHWVPHEDFMGDVRLTVANVDDLSSGEIVYYKDSDSDPIASGTVKTGGIIGSDTIILEGVNGYFEAGDTVDDGDNFSANVSKVESLMFIPISHPDLDITDFKLFITPFDDPHKNFAASAKTIGTIEVSPYIQPNIHLILAAKHVQDVDGAAPFSLQTSVSSRVYSNVTFPRP